MSATAAMAITPSATGRGTHEAITTVHDRVSAIVMRMSTTMSDTIAGRVRPRQMPGIVAQRVTTRATPVTMRAPATA